MALAFEMDYKWSVEIYQCEDFIIVRGWQGNSPSGYINPRTTHGAYINIPNSLEKLFGITLESKIERIRKRCQSWCDRMNARQDNINVILGGRS